MGLPPWPDPNEGQPSHSAGENHTNHGASKNLANHAASQVFTDEKLAGMQEGAFNFLAFGRLRWRIFGPISAIQVLDDAGDATSTLRPFEGHPITSAMATVTDPPRSTIEVGIDSLGSKEAEDEDFEECKYRAPEPLVVQNADGSPITVGDFVAAVHSYMQTNKEEIIDYDEEINGFRPPEAVYYYDGELSSSRDAADVHISLCVGWEGVDEHWASHAENVRRFRQNDSRLSMPTIPWHISRR